MRVVKELVNKTAWSGLALYRRPNLPILLITNLLIGFIVSPPPLKCDWESQSHLRGARRSTSPPLSRPFSFSIGGCWASVLQCRYSFLHSPDNFVSMGIRDLAFLNVARRK
jgi:hypothetical protein